MIFVYEVLIVVERGKGLALLVDELARVDIRALLSQYTFVSEFSCQMIC